jgi:hypothetical protein
MKNNKLLHKQFERLNRLKNAFFLSFLAKRDSCEVNLKYGLVENRL